MKISTILLCTLLAALVGCKKDFLEERSDKRLFVPSTFEDFQNILDNPEVFSVNSYPSIISNTSDDFYITEPAWRGLAVREKNAYIWSSTVDETTNFWSPLYRQVFYANVALDGLSTMDKIQKTQPAWASLRGTGLFYRAFAYYCLAQLFTRPYVVGMTGSEPGVPLRLVADVDKKYPRGTVKDLYSQVIKDLSEAKELLPEKTSYKTRPDKLAAIAMLARINLAIGDYDAAEEYASMGLDIKSALLEYDAVNAAPRRPFPLPLPDKNEEIIWYSSYSGTFTRSTSTFADTLLYQSYDATDRRKTLFFTAPSGKNANFKGSYTGDNLYFAGLATDELFLIHAECLARKSNVAQAMEQLNRLLIKRYIKGHFTPLKALNADEALAKVLQERRKELIGRGTRWADLRRLNLESKFAVTQVRKLGSAQYELLPTQVDKYLFLIPQTEITITGVEQN